VVVTWASKQLARPVKWTSDRSEAFVSDAHGRDHVTTAELALDKDGKFLAMRVRTTRTWAPTSRRSLPASRPSFTRRSSPASTRRRRSTARSRRCSPTPRRVDAYRGAGRPEATYVVERLVETAAREMKKDPAELRRQNFITEFPYQTPVALCYDTGNYAATLDAAMKIADVKNFVNRKEESMKRGKYRGLGYACYIEACGIAPSNVAGSLGARAGLFEAGEVACPCRRAPSTCSPWTSSTCSMVRPRRRATHLPSRHRGPAPERMRAGEDRSPCGWMDADLAASKSPARGRGCPPRGRRDAAGSM